METEQLHKFIKGYSKSDFDKIKFDWNGEHGDELKDPNMVYRMQVCEFLINDFSVSLPISHRF